MFTHNTWANSPRTDHSDDDPHHPTEGAGAHQAWIIKTLAMPNDNHITSPTRGHERPAKKVPSISFLLLSLRESPVLLPSQASLGMTAKISHTPRVKLRCSIACHYTITTTWRVVLFQETKQSLRVDYDADGRLTHTWQQMTIVICDRLFL